MKMTWRDACSELEGPIEVENFRNNVAVGIVVSYSPPVFDFELPAGGGQTQSTRTPHTFLVKSILQLEIIFITVVGVFFLLVGPHSHIALTSALIRARAKHKIPI